MPEISPFALSAPGRSARPVSLPDIPQIAERRVDHIEKQLDAGKLDTETLDKRLQALFGDAAKGIVAQDGSVDFDRLEKLIVETRSEKLQDRITARFGEEGDGIVGSDGSIDKERLRELFAADRTGKIVDRLANHFGAAARELIGEDGKIDFQALKRLIASSDDVPVDDDASGKTDPPSVRPSDQLTELRKTLFEARLERHFGDDAGGVFGEDGKIDTNALRRLFEESGPGRKYSPFQNLSLSQNPFFDIRA